MAKQLEEWRPVLAWPRKYLDGRYEVSDCGRVRRTPFAGGPPAPSIVATGINARGRRVVELRSQFRKKSGKLVEKTFCHLVHILVANAFLGPRPEGIQVTHLDWDRNNNSVENLAFATHDEIMERAAKDGRLPWLIQRQKVA